MSGISVSEKLNFDNDEHQFILSKIKIKETTATNNGYNRFLVFIPNEIILSSKEFVSMVVKKSGIVYCIYTMKKSIEEIRFLIVSNIDFVVRNEEE